MDKLYQELQGEERKKIQGEERKKIQGEERKKRGVQEVCVSYSPAVGSLLRFGRLCAILGTIPVIIPDKWKYSCLDGGKQPFF